MDKSVWLDRDNKNGKTFEVFLSAPVNTGQQPQIVVYDRDGSWKDGVGGTGEVKFDCCDTGWSNAGPSNARQQKTPRLSLLAACLLTRGLEPRICSFTVSSIPGIGTTTSAHWDSATRQYKGFKTKLPSDKYRCPKIVGNHKYATLPLPRARVLAADLISAHNTYTYRLSSHVCVLQLAELRDAR